jgi:glycosyltransferase involved in cell wall biosynthesis
VDARFPTDQAATTPGAIRVVHVIIGLDTGGAELTLYNLAAASSGSVQHIVISLTNEGPVGARLRQAGIEVHTLGTRHPTDALRTALRLRRLLRLLAPDIVQTWMYHADFLGGLAARLAGPWPLIWSVRSADPSRAGWMTRSLQRACAWLSPWVPDLVIFAGDVARRRHEDIGYRPRRALVIRNGFDAQRFRISAAQRRTARARFGFAKSDVVIGWLGRLHLDKDPQTFIRSAGLVAARKPDVRFLMAGRGLDESSPEVAAWSAAAAVEGRLVLAGRQDDPTAVYAAMDIFCLSSCTEAFPNVLGEAMAGALPCVTTNVGDAGVLICDENFRAPPGDPEALAQRMLQLHAIGAQGRLSVGEANRDRVVQAFDKSATHRAYEETYRTLVSSRNKR